MIDYGLKSGSRKFLNLVEKFQNLQGVFLGTYIRWQWQSKDRRLEAHAGKHLWHTS